jgi:hypothetical protein
MNNGGSVCNSGALLLAMVFLNQNIFLIIIKLTKTV